MKTVGTHMHWNVLSPFLHEICSKMFGAGFICIAEELNQHKEIG